MADIIPAEMSAAIEEICLGTDNTDAAAIADALMYDRRIRLHGPEHHFLTAAAILTAYCNMYKPDDKYRFIQMAKSRTVRIPVAVCALYGTCGAMMGAGAAVSIILTAHPFNADVLYAVNKITASIQDELAGYRSIRCCKRAVRASVGGAAAGLNEICGTKLPVHHTACTFSSINESCIEEACRYFE